MDKLVELRSIRKTYRTESVETQALRGIDLDIAKGEYVALTGASGCGKSTLLNILGLLDPQSSGTHQFMGADVSAMTFDERARLRNQHIGFVFQSFHLIPGISVAANVALPVRYARPARVDGAARALELLERVGLSHRAQHRPGQLSGGQQQRVAIARALIMRPSILLLDEPTGNLDAETSDSIMGLIDELNDQETAIVLVTHDARFARRASRQLVVVDGQVEGSA